WEWSRQTMGSELLSQALCRDLRQLANAVPVLSVDQRLGGQPGTAHTHHIIQCQIAPGIIETDPSSGTAARPGQRACTGYPRPTPRPASPHRAATAPYWSFRADRGPRWYPG